MHASTRTHAASLQQAPPWGPSAALLRHTTAHSRPAARLRGHDLCRTTAPWPPPRGRISEHCRPGQGPCRSPRGRPVALDLQIAEPSRSTSGTSGRIPDLPATPAARVGSSSLAPEPRQERSCAQRATPGPHAEKHRHAAGSPTGRPHDRPGYARVRPRGHRRCLQLRHTPASAPGRRGAARSASPSRPWLGLLPRGLRECRHRRAPSCPARTAARASVCPRPARRPTSARARSTSTRRRSRYSCPRA
mmetsp:Transcript_25489/g.85294  ORF Transcript_25489/g.85294 Transcript_25489/m.85294 type:complete len:248 (-) Transcript_25489:195-938(-)